MIWFFIGLLWGTTHQGALGATSTITPFELGYSVRGWNMDDGLTGPYIGAMMQAADGAFLFSDSAGVMRYNGIEFRSLTQSAESNVPIRQILRLHEDKRGRLWMSGLQGQGMRHRDGSFQEIGSDLGGSSGVGAFAEAGDGTLWSAMTSGGRSLMLSYWEDGRFQPALDEDLEAGYTRTMEISEDGQLWLTTVNNLSGGPLFRLKDRQLIPYPIEGNIAALFKKTGDTRLWCAGIRGIYVLDDDEWQLSLAFSEPLRNVGGVNACEVDVDGNTWIATRMHGLLVCRPDGAIRKVVSPRVKIPNFVRDIFIDRDGTLWTPGENGLLQLFRRSFTMWPAAQRSQQSPIRVLCEDSEGTLWFGSDGIYSLSPSGFVREHSEGFTPPSVYAFAKRQEGGLWYTGWGGPLRFITHDGVDHPTTIDLPTGFVRNIVECQGDLWMCKEHVLLRLEDDQMIPDHPPEAQQDQPRSILAGEDGTLYVGFAKAGFFQKKEGMWTRLDAHEAIETISQDPDQGIWVRSGSDQLGWYSEGVWRFEKVETLGIPPEFSMLCTSKDSIWFQAPVGPVVQLRRSALEAWLQGDHSVQLELRRFGKVDGLAAESAPEGPRPGTLLEDQQGRVWFATIQGACVYDPSHASSRTAEKGSDIPPMPIVIEKLLVDGVSKDAARKSLVMEPGDQRLEIHFAGLDLANPKSVRYRYRLEGLDEDWIDVENRHTVYFQDLPPGNYRFQVIGANRFGDWNLDGASLGVYVQPQWYERASVRYGIPSMMLVVFVSLVLIRMQRVNRRAMEKVRMKEAFSRGLIETQEAERMRIAGELHDDLGQDLLVIKSRIDMARRKLTSESTEELLEPLSKSTAEIMRKVRSMSQELRPFHLDHLGLSSSIMKMARDVSEASGIQIESKIDDMKDALSKDSEVAIYRIVQESFNNVIKHAKARYVKIELKRHATCFILTIVDDGEGFEDKAKDRAKHPSGQGLQTMGERCQLIGGSFHVESSPGRGTRISIEVPLNRLTDTV